MSKSRVLIIEDQERVAGAIEHQLLQIGGFIVAQSRSASQALERISAAQKQPFDLLLCDYNLGENTNGQQLLEYLRHNRRIPRRTGFIMLTAESSYAAVASAVELVPDGYLLKPFTQDALDQRISAALGKREAMQSVYAALDQEEPDWNTAMSACNAIILAGNRYALEALKVKAECLISLGNWGEAATVYDKIVAWRPTAWAEVGRARALRHMGYPELAVDKLKAALQTFPQFVPAFDELASLAETQGEHEKAQQILEMAHAIVPSNRRTRQLGLLALENGDLKKASTYLKVVTEKDRHGLMRSTDDFFGLASALRQLGRHDEAITVLDGLKEHFPETRALTVRKMAAEALVVTASGRGHDARKRVRDAMELRTARMDPKTQLELAEACQACGEEETAREIFLHVAENWQEDPAVVAKVKSTMARAGNPEWAAGMVEASLRELIATNNEAAAMLKQGRVDDVVAKMEVVAKRLPNHATVQANYAQALLLWLEQNAPPALMDLPHHSKPRRYVTTAREHIRLLASVSPNHPRLPFLQRLFAKITGEQRVAANIGAQDEEESGTLVVGE